MNVQEPSSTGLDPAVAAALAYLAGPFSAIIILAAERTSTYVRFHAWQAIIALGGLGLVSFAFLILAFLSLLISPFLFRTFYALAGLTAVLWLVVWVMCLLKAFAGAAWRLPLAGRWAELRARVA